MNRISQILTSIVVVFLVGCYHYVEVSQSTNKCNNDGFIYNYRSFKGKNSIKNPNGLLHYYVVDTIELNNPIVVKIDVNSSFIMEKSVFDVLEPTYKNYIDNDFVYLYADEAVAGGVRSIYPLRDSIVCDYSSRINFFDYGDESVMHYFGGVPDRYSSLDFKRETKKIYKNNCVIMVSSWDTPPKRFVVLLVRGDTYREISYCQIQYEIIGRVSISPLPISNHYSYYKMLYPIFE